MSTGRSVSPVGIADNILWDECTTAVHQPQEHDFFQTDFFSKFGIYHYESIDHDDKTNQSFEKRCDDGVIDEIIAMLNPVYGNVTLSTKCLSGTKTNVLRSTATVTLDENTLDDGDDDDIEVVTAFNSLEKFSLLQDNDYDSSLLFSLSPSPLQSPECMYAVMRIKLLKQLFPIDDNEIKHFSGNSICVY
jgi:hypothetical protein